ncbi:protein of unknown function DUF4283 [Macleaya cordata]|uniref:DUF4283 domain-containing protein n=1 Tax=Macleaya cordata TaxID=56857 RepID=A0A200QIM9_MACCD|nr:protein of unknown function DUF4283 [Macleaya cordata]
MPALATSSESRGAPTVLALPPSKQYASLLAPRPSTSTPTWVPEYRLSMKDGIPAIRFSPHDLLRSEQIMAFSLILKFSAGRPPLNDIKAHIELHWGLTGKYVVGLIDPRHILLRLSSELEVTKVLVREKKHIQGYWFRIFRWSSSFNPKKESSLAPVWVLIPRLPMNYFSNEMMHGIAERIGGRLLKVDNPTLGHSRPSVARICLEIDLAKPITESIWFWSSKDEGKARNLLAHLLP